jgi:hypothetical protein
LSEFVKELFSIFYSADARRELIFQGYLQTIQEYRR